MNTFYTNWNQSVLLITVCVIALIGYCVPACRRYTLCCYYLCTRLRLMCWNPHGEMMCSAEGWQSQGERLTMSEPCWTTYMFRTTAPVCQQQGSANPLCSHYLPDFSSLSCSVAVVAAAAVYPCIVFMSHITHLIFVCCLLEHESLPLWIVRASGLNVERGGKNCIHFTAGPF